MSGLSPENSAIHVNKTLEEKIAAATSQAEIETLMHEAALAQHLVAPDLFDETVLHPTNVAPQILEKTISVNGQTHTIRGASEGELAHNEAALFRNLFAHKPDAAEPPRDERGRFVPAEPEPQSADEVARNAELELAFKRGDITAAQYIEKSGVVDAAIERRENAKISGDTLLWKSATDSFLQSESAANYPGGEEYLRRMYDCLLENGWENNPSAETLQAAWQILQQEDYEAEIAQKAQSTNDPYELRNRLQPGSSLFGR
jgi:hypothetical protein